MAVGQANMARRRIGGIWIVVGAIALVAVVGGIVAVTALRGSARFHVRFKDMSGLQTTQPPWRNDSGGLASRLSALHLDRLPASTAAVQMDAHLDTYVDGKHVVVPAGIGVEPGAFITELHTQTADGVIHLEATHPHPYQLGQFFGEWAVRVNARCLADDCTRLSWWVNGMRQTGNPAELVLRPHQEIVIASGTPPAKIPGHYRFAPGA